MTDIEFSPHMGVELIEACSHDPCKEPALWKGFCKTHYHRNHHGRRMDEPLTVEGKFWDRVDMSGECWLWAGQVNAKGYGILYVAGKNVRAHRLSYELHIGPIPSGLVIDHLCYTPGCVRPDHLRAVTSGMNNQNRSGVMASSKSGIRGVEYRESTGSYHPYIFQDRRKVGLGTFKSADEAARVREQAETETYEYLAEIRGSDGN